MLVGRNGSFIRNIVVNEWNVSTQRIEKSHVLLVIREKCVRLSSKISRRELSLAAVFSLSERFPTW